MVNHIYDEELDTTVCGLYRGELARCISGPNYSCSACINAATEPEMDWADERNDVLNRFLDELYKVTGDGSKKRQAGTKPPWHQDDAHEGAIFSHLTKWKRGETIDPDSGAHTLVHLAWRALAIACRETGNTP